MSLRARFAIALAVPFLLLASLGSSGQEVPPNVWNVKGRDTVGWTWTAKLVFLEESNQGYFEWKSSGGASGREVFTYTYDEKTGKLRIEGEKVVDPKGNITFATYSATLSKDGERLEKGRWWGPNVVPGTWSATRAEPE